MTTNEELSEEAIQAAKDRIAKSAASDRGPQSGEKLVTDGMKTYCVSCTLEIEVSVQAASEEDALLWTVTSVRTKDDNNFKAGVTDVEIGRLDVTEITEP